MSAVALITDRSSHTESISEETALVPADAAPRKAASIDEIIHSRVKAISVVASTAKRQMGLGSIEKDLVMHVDIQKVRAEPSVRSKGHKIILSIPLLMLLRAEDFKASSPVRPFLNKFFQSKILTKREQIEIDAFFKFIENPEMAERAKIFVIYHEIAHIYHKDIYSNANSLAECQGREKRADLTAAAFSGQTKAGIYLFNIMKEYESNDKVGTHPLFKDRVQYLSELSAFDISSEQIALTE